MTYSRRIILAGLTAILLGGASAVADDVRELTWEELIPEGEAIEVQPDSMRGNEYLFEDEAAEEGSFEDALASPAYPAGVVEELDGISAKLPGFVVPLELAGEGMLKEFLLVPYFGACIHYPPPPPNQIVYVVLDEPIDIEMTWGPIWAIGELKTEGHNAGVGTAGYTMAAQLVEEYEY